MRSKSRDKRLKRASQPKLRSTTPPARQQHEAALGLGQLDHAQLDAGGLGVLARLLARVTLIGPGHPHRLARGLLHRLAQRALTCDRSCSLAGVTVSSISWPSVSTAMCTLEPRLRL